MTLDGAWALRWMQLAAESVRARSSELTEMDAVIGDGDHGTNLDRGMQAVLEALDGLRRAHPEAAPTIGQVLHTVATSLTTTVGGAAGPLLGASHRSLVTVREATGTLPTASAHAVPGDGPAPIFELDVVIPTAASGTQEDHHDGQT